MWAIRDGNCPMATTRGLNLNQIPDSALSLGAALREQVPNPFFGLVASGPLASRTVERRQLLRPYPQFLNVNIPDMPGASSSYNAFVAKLNKRFSGGLTLIASYQFSKAIDNASENQGWEINDRYRNANNLSLERSISGHDMPHSMAVAYIYELPVGKNRKLGSNMHPVADAVLGGWQVSGIVKMDSGLPLRFQAPQNDFSYSLWQYPNVTDVKAAGLDNRTIDRWFNTSAFTLAGRLFLWECSTILPQHPIRTNQQLGLVAGQELRHQGAPPRTVQG